MIPLRYLAERPINLIFGLGLGSVSESNLGPSFTGDYFNFFSSFTIHSASVHLLEIGILGTALIFYLLWLTFRDAINVASRNNELVGALAVAWPGICAVMALGMFYKVTYIFPSVSYLFWFFAGLIASQRVRQIQEQVIKPSANADRNRTGPAQCMDFEPPHRPINARSMSSASRR